jgi:membrane-anchored protein YejM (alkaline phosphatase superfamily)
MISSGMYLRIKEYFIEAKYRSRKLFTTEFVKNKLHGPEALKLNGSIQTIFLIFVLSICGVCLPSFIAEHVYLRRKHRFIQNLFTKVVAAVLVIGRVAFRSVFIYPSIRKKRSIGKV